MSELARRVLFGVPAGAFFLFLIWLGGTVFQFLAAGLALLVLFEMTRIFSRMSVPAYTGPSLLLAFFFWFASGIPSGLAAAVTVLILALTVPAAVVRSEISNRWLVTLFCSLYAPLGFLFFYRVRAIEPDETGMWLAYALILMIWGNDVFAYFGGRRFGRRPLAPLISPKKTWEGFWFGFAGSLTGLLIIWRLAEPFPLDLVTALPMVLLVSTFGPAGDLLESRLKRLADLKDSSRLLPGHGGFFDRFDALVFSSPVIYIYLRWVL